MDPVYPDEIPDIEALDKRVIDPSDWAYLCANLQALFDVTGINPQGSKGTIADRLGSEGSIGTTDLADGSVTNDKLAGGITNDKLAGGITNDKLAGGITNAQLAGGITGDKIAGDQIGSAHVLDGSLTKFDLAAGASLWTVAQLQRTDLVGQTGSTPLPDYLSVSVTPRSAAVPIRIAFTLMGTIIGGGGGVDAKWRVKLKIDGAPALEIERFVQATNQVPWSVTWEQWFYLSAAAHTVALDIYQPGGLSYYALNTLSGGSLVCDVGT